MQIELFIKKAIKFFLEIFYELIITDQLKANILIHRQLINSINRDNNDSNYIFLSQICQIHFTISH